MSDQPPIVLESAGAHHFSVIWLHGLGADGSDFVPIVRELSLPEALGVRFVFPHAPVMPVTVNNGFPMRAWYDIRLPELGADIDADGIRTSVAALQDMVAAEVARGVPLERIVIAGFSQGGVIALAAALAMPVKPLAVIALSTYLPVRDAPAPGQLEIFQAHGRQDPVVPLALGTDARDYLVGLGHSVSWHEYMMPHAVLPEEIDAIRDWLLARFAAAEWSAGGAQV